MCLLPQKYKILKCFSRLIDKLGLWFGSTHLCISQRKCWSLVPGTCCQQTPGSSLNSGAYNNTIVRKGWYSWERYRQTEYVGPLYITEFWKCGHSSCLYPVFSVQTCLLSFPLPFATCFKIYLISYVSQAFSHNLLVFLFCDLFCTLPGGVLRDNHCIMMDRILHDRLTALETSILHHSLYTWTLLCYFAAAPIKGQKVLSCLLKLSSAMWWALSNRLLANMMLAEAWKRTCPFWLALLSLLHIYDNDVPSLPAVPRRKITNTGCEVMASQIQSRPADSHLAADVWASPARASRNIQQSSA